MVIGGAPETLQIAYDDISAGTPVVIVEGSGGAADVLSHVYNKSMDETDKEILHRYVKGDVKKMFKKKKGLINIFQLNSSDSTKTVDDIIFQVLRKGDNVGAVNMMHLRVALSSNSIDTAKNMLENKQQDSQVTTEEQLAELVKIAIYEEKIDFVKYIMQRSNDTFLHDFISDEMLSWLYAKTYEKDEEDSASTSDNGASPNIKHCPESVYNVLNQWVSFEAPLANNEQNVCARLKKCFSPSYCHIKWTGEKDQMLLLLLVWVIITRRFEIAKHLWTKIIKKEEIAAALLMTTILKQMKSKWRDDEEKRNVSELMDFFEVQAVGLLKQCYDNNQFKTRCLLTRKMSSFSEETVLDLASSADNLHFVELSACQNLLSTVWRSGMDVNTTRFQIVVSLIFPVIAPFCISFRKTEEGQPKTYYGKTKTFFKAPITVFSYTCIWYLIFLMMFNVILLGDVADANILWIVLAVWVFTMIVEEIRQGRKFGVYIQNKWNLMDGLALIMFIPAIILKWTEKQDTAQVFLSLDMMLFSLRILQMFTFNRKLGPVLIMILEMIKEMASFIVILLVIVLAYGTSLQAIIYPNSSLGFVPILGAILKRSMYSMYGKFSVDELDGSTECNSTQTPQTSCPKITSFIPVLMEILYVLFTSILMINLLIAKFSYAFQKIQDKTYQVWCTQRYNAIIDILDNSVFPPQLNIILLIIQMFKCKCRKQKSNLLSKEYNDSLTKELIKWEQKCAEEYSCQEKKRLQNTVASKIDTLQKQIQEVTDLLGRPAETTQ